MKLNNIITEAKGERFSVNINIDAKLKGDSLWDDPGKKGEKVRVKKITFATFYGKLDDKNSDIHVLVYHDHPWEIYTDSGFEKEVSTILSTLTKKKIKVGFTEQGMQKNKLASMEPRSKVSNQTLKAWVKFKIRE